MHYSKIMLTTVIPTPKAHFARTYSYIQNTAVRRGCQWEVWAIFLRDTSLLLLCLIDPYLDDKVWNAQSRYVTLGHLFHQYRSDCKSWLATPSHSVLGYLLGINTLCHMENVKPLIILIFSIDLLDLYTVFIMDLFLSPLFTFSFTLHIN